MHKFEMHHVHKTNGTHSVQKLQQCLLCAYTFSSGALFRAYVNFAQPYSTRFEHCS